MGILGFNSVEWFASGLGAIYAGYVIERVHDLVTKCDVYYHIYIEDYQLVYTLLAVQKLVTTFWRTVKLIL